MGSRGKLSYQRLRNGEELDEEILEREVKKAKAWLKFKALAGRRRPKVRVAGLRRFLRKRSRFVNRLRVPWRKALQKLKNGQSYMNDLFGGNYLFMQCNPSPFRYGEKPHIDHHGLRGSPASYSFSWKAPLNNA